MQRRHLFGSPGAGTRVPAPCAITRRDAIALGAVVTCNCILGAAAGLAEPADERPHAGDQLVAIFTMAYSMRESFGDEDLTLIGSLRWKAAEASGTR